MGFESGGNNPFKCSARVNRGGGGSYEYAFTPTILVGTPLPERAATLLRQLGGGFTAAAVLNGPSVLGMSIPANSPRDKVEALFAALRTFEMNIGITTETYPAPRPNPVDDARSTLNGNFTVTGNTSDPDWRNKMVEALRRKLG